MEETKNGAVNMTLGEMKNYLAEWFLGTSVKIEVGKYDTFDRKVVITEADSGVVIFTREFSVNELVTDDAIVSTSSIVNEELRGLVEQCYRLDKQLEESTKERESKSQNANQKQ